MAREEDGGAGLIITTEQQGKGTGIIRAKIETTLYQAAMDLLIIINTSTNREHTHLWDHSAGTDSSLLFLAPSSSKQSKERGKGRHSLASCAASFTSCCDAAPQFQRGVCAMQETRAGVLEPVTSLALAPACSGRGTATAPLTTAVYVVWGR